MPIGISVKADIRAATQFLLTNRKQIPFATSIALNRSAWKIREVEQATMKIDLDRPTPQTVKAVRVKQSTKRNLTASVFLLPWAHKYLSYQIAGGWRNPRSFAEAVPVEIKLNKYGNIAGRRNKKLKHLLNRPDVFSGTINGVAGIWQRGRGRQRNIKVKLLIAYEKRTHYVASRWPFYKYATNTVNRIWRGQFNQALRQALR